MSVPEQDPINQIIIVGGETTAPWTWNLQKEDEIVVTKLVALTEVIELLILGVDYTVNPAGLGDDNGGTINFEAAQLPAVAGDIWTMSRDTTLNRSDNFAKSGDFFAQTINDQLDKLTRIAQDSDRDAVTAVRKNPGVGDTLDPLIPQMEDRRTLIFQDNGGGDFEMVMSDNDPDEQANEAAVSADAAAQSATDAETAQTAAETAETNAETAEANAADSASEAAANAATGYLKNILLVSSNTVLTVSNQGNEIRVDTSSGDIDITLPDSTGLSEDFRVAIIKETGDANNINVKRSGTDTINGSASDDVIETQFDRRTFSLDQSAGTYIADSAADLSSPGPIGETTPSTMKATTFEGDAGGTTINEFSTDDTFGDDSDDAVPTEKATKGFIEVANVASQAEMETATDITKKVTPGRQQFHPSASKASAIFNSSGTIAASFNVSSVTDNGTGDWTVNFTTSFSSVNYIALATISRPAVPSTVIYEGPTKTASACQFKTVRTDTQGVADTDRINTGFFGDQ